MCVSSMTFVPSPLSTFIFRRALWGWGFVSPLLCPFCRWGNWGLKVSHAYLRVYLRVTVGHQSGSLCTGPAALARLWGIVRGGATNIQKPWLVLYLVPGTFTLFLSAFTTILSPQWGFLFYRCGKWGSQRSSDLPKSCRVGVTKLGFELGSERL